MIYFYTIIRGKATLNKGDSSKLITIGCFASDEKAKEACAKHHENACKSSINFNRPSPAIAYL